MYNRLTVEGLGTGLQFNSSTRSSHPNPIFWISAFTNLFRDVEKKSIPFQNGCTNLRCEEKDSLNYME